MIGDRLTRIGEIAHGTVRHEDVCWMISEIERLRPALRKAVAILETIFGQLGDPPEACQADFVEIVNALREGETD